MVYPHPDWRGHLQVALAMAMVGSFVVVGKLLDAALPIGVLSWLRFSVALLVLWPWVYWKKLPQPQGREWGQLALAAFCGVFGFSLCTLYGVRDLPGIEAGILLGTLPACVALVAWGLLKQRPDRRATIAIVLACLATVLLQTPAQSVVGGHALRGSVLIILALLGEGVFAAMGQTLGQRLSPLVVTTWVSTFAWLMFLPLAVWEAPRVVWSQLGWPHLATVLYLGLGITVLCFVLFFHGVRQISSAATGVLTTVLPLSATLFSALILHEPLQLQHAAALGLVVAAVLVVVRPAATVQPA
ncbi:DMT family transporter [Leeia sp.]|uniref:DMT family transporter n=1 Tax=Leeia sp. TaxID=2884678 RepID=UPI0035B249F9